jgi:hypothetical protein
MSDKRLTRIEKKLAKLARQQDRFCSELAALRDADAPAPRGADPEEVLGFLDQFRAGEVLGEASAGAWIAVCQTDCVRGGLRTVQMREGIHARLLEERIKELGGTPQHELPEEIQSAAMNDAGDPDKSDALKLKEFVARIPDVDLALAPIHDLAARLGHDPETQSLLRTIAQDERSTLEWFREACQLLNG